MNLFFSMRVLFCILIFSASSLLAMQTLTFNDECSDNYSISICKQMGSFAAMYGDCGECVPTPISMQCTKKEFESLVPLLQALEQNKSQEECRQCIVNGDVGTTHQEKVQFLYSLTQLSNHLHIKNEHVDATDLLAKETAAAIEEFCKIDGVTDDATKNKIAEISNFISFTEEHNDIHQKIINSMTTNVLYFEKVADACETDIVCYSPDKKCKLLTNGQLIRCNDNVVIAKFPCHKNVDNNFALRRYGPLHKQFSENCIFSSEDKFLLRITDKHLSLINVHENQIIKRMDAESRDGVYSYHIGRREKIPQFNEDGTRLLVFATIGGDRAWLLDTATGDLLQQYDNVAEACFCASNRLLLIFYDHHGRTYKCRFINMQGKEMILSEATLSKDYALDPTRKKVWLLLHEPKDNYRIIDTNDEKIAEGRIQDLYTYSENVIFSPKGNFCLLQYKHNQFFLLNISDAVKALDQPIGLKQSCRDYEVVKCSWSASEKYIAFFWTTSVGYDRNKVIIKIVAVNSGSEKIIETEASCHACWTLVWHPTQDIFFLHETHGRFYIYDASTVQKLNGFASTHFTFGQGFIAEKDFSLDKKFLCVDFYNFPASSIFFLPNPSCLVNSLGQVVKTFGVKECVKFDQTNNQCIIVDNSYFAAKVLSSLPIAIILTYIKVNACETLDDTLRQLLDQYKALNLQSCASDAIAKLVEEHFLFAINQSTIAQTRIESSIKKTSSTFFSYKKLFVVGIVGFLIYKYFYSR